MGVQQKAYFVIFHEPPEERGGIGISHSAYENRKRQTVWTAERKGSGLAIDERTYLSSGANNDVIVADVKRTGQKMTRVINIYDQRDVRTGETQARNINWNRIIRQTGSR